MFKSYTQLPFVDEKAKVNASYYVTKLLPNLIKDCRHLLLDNFIFQQDGAPAHAAALAQDWVKKKFPGFIGNKKGQLSLTNPRDACKTFARFV